MYSPWLEMQAYCHFRQGLPLDLRGSAIDEERPMPELPPVTRVILPSCLVAWATCVLMWPGSAADSPPLLREGRSEI
jgi:hypothetical protein